MDAAIDSMSGISSQPSLGAIVRSMENTMRATGAFEGLFEVT